MGNTHAADMNDICTTLDPAFEPKYVAAAHIGPYPAVMKARLRQYYPHIKPFYYSDAPKVVFDAIKALVAKERLWTLKHEDAESLVIEFEAKTRVMKFTDDVVCQVKPWGNGGSVINLRSRSRVGTGDWGANFKRIEYLNKKLTGVTSVPAPAGSEASQYVDAAQADNAASS